MPSARHEVVRRSAIVETVQPVQNLYLRNPQSCYLNGMQLTCNHLGAPTGSHRDRIGTQIEFRCRHHKHNETTYCDCLLCEHFFRPPEESDEPGGWVTTGKRATCPHPLGMIVDRYEADAGLANLYNQTPGFLVLGGPSTKTMPLELLAQRGCLILSANNNAAVLPYPLRPHVWIHTDPSKKFHDSIWRDPAILKFVPIRDWNLGANNKRALRYRNEEGKLVVRDGVCSRQMPAVFGFHRTTTFDPETWCYHPEINRGNDDAHANGNEKKGVSPNGWPNVINTMFSAVRLAFFLGVNPLYLLGCDFHMDYERPYGFTQDKSKGGVNANNHAFSKMDHMFKALVPKFAEAGFEVFNCTPGSALWAFPHKDFQEAVAEVTAGFEKELNCDGYYDATENK